MTPLEYVQQRKIVAIVRGLKPEYIVRLGHAFEEGGIGLMEVTYDQKAPETWKNTAAAIEAVEKEFGDRVLVGAGTVITPCSEASISAESIISNCARRCCPAERISKMPPRPHMPGGQIVISSFPETNPFTCPAGKRTSPL